METEIEKQDEPAIIDLLGLAYQEACEEQKLAGRTDSSWMPDWCMDQLAKLEASTVAYKARFEWLIERNKKYAKQIHDRYDVYVQDETSRQLEKANGKAKSVTFAAGRCGYRHQNVKLVITNDSEAVTWAAKNMSAKDFFACASSIDIGLFRALPEKIFETCESCNDCTEGIEAYEVSKCVNKVNVGPLLKYFKKTGDVPDGCEVVEEYEKFYIEPLQLAIEGSK